MTPPAERRLLAIAMRLVAAVTLTLMFAVVKLADGRGVNLFESLFYRQALALPLVLGWIAAGPGLPSVRTHRPGAHLWRTIVGMAGMALNFTTFILLPLAEATVLLFTVPIFATILSAVLLKEPVGLHRWAAVLIGFAGVLVVVLPGGAGMSTKGVAVGLVAALVVSGVSITLRQIGRTESATTTVFWFTVISTVAMGLLMPVFGRMHDTETFGLLLALGLLGGAAQLALTASLRLAPVSVVLPMDYSNLVWSALIGWLIFSTLPSHTLWLGAPLIIASGLYIVYREHRLHREKTAAAGAID
ncbi:DMT family transporter [Sphingomonas sp. ID1715]|uniref:DMT family transporter n=1 Tax=Sphingomonas sp. ID1715 TaxID=1656898 RepID=UPI00148969D8|nr:DMT family transporter [Sphingomonas sp. ID1715]NNM77168.1 DMT family transporter [Sphingomonas sp. ID1715]